MEHDERCHLHDREILLLKEQFRVANETMHEVVARLQDLVQQYHTQNTAQATVLLDLGHIRAKVDQIDESLSKDFALRSEFVEIKSEWRTFLKIILTAVIATIMAGLSWAGWSIRGGGK